MLYFSPQQALRPVLHFSLRRCLSEGLHRFKIEAEKIQENFQLNNMFRFFKPRELLRNKNHEKAYVKTKLIFRS